MRLLLIWLWLLLPVLALAQEAEPAPQPGDQGDPWGEPEAPGPQEPTSLLGTLTDPLVRLRARPHASGLVRPGEWSAAWVRIENLGDPLSGELVLTLPGQGFNDVTVRRKVDLPAGARREIVLPFKGPSRASSYRLEFLAGRRSTFTNLTLRTAAEADVIIGIIGDEAAGIQSVRDVAPGLQRLPPGRGTSDLSYVDSNVGSGLLPVAGLPDQAQIYEPYSWLVWIDADPTALSPAQADALMAHVASGGHLLLTVTERWRQVSDGPLSEILPIELVGVSETGGAAELAQVLDLSNIPTSGQPQAVGRLRSERGFVRSMLESYVGETDQPVWAAGLVGLGSVHVLTVDPRPLVGQSAQDAERFWREVLALPHGGTLSPDSVWQDQYDLYNALTDVGWSPSVYGEQVSVPEEDVIAAFLRDIPGVQPIPLPWLVGFAGLYLLLIGPVDYLVLRWLKREVLTWVTFPVTILVFSGLALAGTTYVKGTQTVLTRFEIIELLPNTPFWRGSSLYGIWATQRVRVDLQSGFDQGLGDPLEGLGLSADPTIEHGSGPSRGVLTAQTWALTHARTSFVARHPGELRLEVDSEGGLTIHNDLPMDLEQVGWCGIDKLVMVGPLLAGASTAVDESRWHDLTFHGDPLDNMPRWALTQACSGYAARWRPTHSSRQGGVIVAMLPEPVEPSVLSGMDPTVRAVSVIRRPVLDSEYHPRGRAP